MLPDRVPFFVFFLPNFLGIAFALALESFQVETNIITVASRFSSLFPFGSRYIYHGQYSVIFEWVRRICSDRLQCKVAQSIC